MKKFVLYGLAICGAFVVGNALALGTHSSEIAIKAPIAKVLLPEATRVVQKAIPAPIDTAKLEEAWRDWMVRFGVSTGSLG